VSFGLGTLSGDRVGPMGKRKSAEVEHEVEDSPKEQDRFIGMDSEGDDGVASSELDERMKENISDVEQSGEELLVGEVGNDPGVGQDDEEIDSELDDQAGSNPFSRAFGKIMKKSVPQSTITDISASV
jgi:hypothetical protein